MSTDVVRVLIKESFFWPNRGGAAERPEVDARILAGYEHRQRAVDAGKAQWFVAYGDVTTGFLVLHMPMDEYQEFVATDPWFGLLKSEVTVIYDASGHPERYKKALAQVNYKSRIAKSPLTSGDLSIASLAPDMARRLADTDLNSY